jgi:hypothetical protein
MADAPDSKIRSSQEGVGSSPTFGNGRHPSKLDELVPKYLTSVPPAKHCMMGVFSYRNSDGHCTLWWTRYGFYRRIYNFDEKRWSNLD